MVGVCGGRRYVVELLASWHACTLGQDSLPRSLARSLTRSLAIFLGLSLFAPPTPAKQTLALAAKPALTAAQTKTRLKCVAVDLDNTLWPGVLVEQEGKVKLSAGHLELHQMLLSLRARGVLLLTCSRNNEAAVLAAWEQIPPEAMALRPEHFVCHRIDWTPKSERLRAFAAAIGLAHDALLFIDDLEHERAEVAAAMPNCRIVDERVAAAVLRAELRAAEEAAGGRGVTFDAASRTERTQALLRRAEAARQHSSGPARGGHSKGGDKRRRKAAKAATGVSRVSGTGGGYAKTGGYPDSFLKTLDLRLCLRELDLLDHSSEGLRRACELAARTTQFNTALPSPEKEVQKTLETILRGGGQVWEMRLPPSPFLSLYHTCKRAHACSTHTHTLQLNLPLHPDNPPSITHTEL